MHTGFEKDYQSIMDFKTQRKWTVLLDRLLNRSTQECVFKLDSDDELLGSDSDEIKSYISELEMRASN